MTTKWKQPVGYYLTHSTMAATILKDRLLELITLLQGIGLTVVATVCDQGTNNRSMYRALGVSQDSPVFTVGDQQVVAIYDSPHLLKNIRNGMKKYGYIVDGECYMHLFSLQLILLGIIVL